MGQKYQVVMVRPRIYIGDKISIGPGKINLLKEIASTHSIAAAARVLKMPYKRAWLLIDSLNQGFGSPVVETSAGGKGGGRTTLTPLGLAIIERYLALETRLNTTSSEELDALCELAQ